MDNPFEPSKDNSILPETSSQDTEISTVDSSVMETSTVETPGNKSSTADGIRGTTSSASEMSGNKSSIADEFSEQAQIPQQETSENNPPVTETSSPSEPAAGDKTVTETPDQNTEISTVDSSVMETSPVETSGNKSSAADEICDTTSSSSELSGNKSSIADEFSEEAQIPQHETSENNPPVTETSSPSEPADGDKTVTETPDLNMEISPVKGSVTETSIVDSSAKSVPKSSTGGTTGDTSTAKTSDTKSSSDETSEKENFSQVTGSPQETSENNPPVPETSTKKSTSEISKVNTSDSKPSDAETSANKPLIGSSSGKSRYKVNPDRKLKKILQIDLGFLMKVKPATVLQKAVAALSESTFNPMMLGLIEVGAPGFEITVYKREGLGDEFGLLSLNADDLDEFQCQKPFRSMVSLFAMKTILSGVDEDDDVATVFHVLGTNFLSFRLGTPISETAPGGTFALHVDLLGDDPYYKKFPDVSYGFGAVIESEDLLPMCKEVLLRPVGRRPKLVSLSLDTSVKIQVDTGDMTTPEKKRHAWMVWPYWESLEDAASAGEGCLLSLITDPDECIMLRFQLAGLGDLVFLVEGNFFFDTALACVAQFSSLL